MRLLHAALALSVIGLGRLSQARVEVAFLESYNPDGSRLELELGDRFAHSAIAHRGRWLQAHPWGGVDLVSREKLNQMGTLRVRLVDESEPDLSDELVRSFVGRPFDNDFDWSEDESLYCAELVGKFLHVQPQPMHFDERWPPKVRRLEGKPGLSPDKLYRALKKRGYREIQEN